MEFAVDHRTSPLAAAPSRAEVGRRDRLQRSGALRDVLAELGERVRPVSLARERTIPVAAPFDQLLPDEGLVRGRVVSCRGLADTSLAFGLIREALVGGAWAAVVDVSTFGADAASEFGIPLERIVRVESDAAEAKRSAGVGSVASWVDVMGAAVDGFDVVVTRVPAELCGDQRPPAVRKLATRVQQKGAVVVVLGETGALRSDLVFSTQRTTWGGVSDGAGHLRSRIIDVVAGGRRLPASRTVSLSVDAVSGRVACSLAVDRDPQAELLAEMANSLVVTDLADDADATDATETICDDGRRLAG